MLVETLRSISFAVAPDSDDGGSNIDTGPLMVYRLSSHCRFERMMIVAAL